MTNFSIDFTNPWLLFLLIPAVFIVLFPYFRMAKRYRRTRNRIVSMVLCITVMVLGISVLSGLHFDYDVVNNNNEVILLIDASYSGGNVENEKEDFVQGVINSSSENFKVGIVTFGYDTVYAVPITAETDGIYRKYLAAPRPDDSASDISGALEYTRTLFKNPETAKIVLISDGLETDGSALSVIRSIAAEGIKVDTACFTAERTDSEVQLVDITLPKTNIAVGDKFNVSLTVLSSYQGKATFTMYDTVFDDDMNESTQVVAGVSDFDLKTGEQTVTVEHEFNEPGMHRLHFSVESAGDTLMQNNGYYSYIDLQVYDKVLIIERTAGESQAFGDILAEKYETVDTVTVTDAENMPQTVDAVREYDQVVMFNISNLDMPQGFEAVLNSYVSDFGGGMLTVGGNKEENGKEVANTYNREAMLQSEYYQAMLPVQAVDYTPPLGTVVIIDRSGSMMSNDATTGKRLFDLAKEGAKSCLYAMTERDWCGIMTLETGYSEELTLTPLTLQHKIVEAIDAISDEGGGTAFAPAIAQAGRALRALKEVEKKHIILVTDGEPGDSFDTYNAAIAENTKNNITFSIVVVGNTNRKDLEIAAEETGKGHFYKVTNGEELTRIMREDLTVPEIKDLIFDENGFTPRIGTHTSVVNGVLDLITGENAEEMPKMYGYYGTKLKSGENIKVDTPLMGEFVPLYAQWAYGKGNVGSFMSDLNGNWSRDFLASNVGKAFIYGMVNALFPTEDIRSRDLDALLKEDNYSTQMSVYTELKETETLEITVTPPQTDGRAESDSTVIKFTAKDNYSRVTFKNTLPGIHRIVLQKKDAQGNVLSEFVTYRAFSYSKEYDVFADTEAGTALMTDLAKGGNGKVLTDPWEAYDNSVENFHRTYDPRVPFIIIALILFLLDIAVRKFKFKWLHEIIRDRKNRKNNANGERSAS